MNELTDQLKIERHDEAVRILSEFLDNPEIFEMANGTNSDKVDYQNVVAMIRETLIGFYDLVEACKTSRLVITEMQFQIDAYDQKLKELMKEKLGVDAIVNALSVSINPIFTDDNHDYVEAIDIKMMGQADPHKRRFEWDLRLEYASNKWGLRLPVGKNGVVLPDYEMAERGIKVADEKSADRKNYVFYKMVCSIFKLLELHGKNDAPTVKMLVEEIVDKEMRID